MAAECNSRVQQLSAAADKDVVYINKTKTNNTHKKKGWQAHTKASGSVHDPMLTALCCSLVCLCSTVDGSLLQSTNCLWLSHSTVGKSPTSATPPSPK